MLRSIARPTDWFTLGCTTSSAAMVANTGSAPGTMKLATTQAAIIAIAVFATCRNGTRVDVRMFAGIRRATVPGYRAQPAATVSASTPEVPRKRPYVAALRRSCARCVDVNAASGTASTVTPPVPARRRQVPTIRPRATTMGANTPFPPGTTTDAFSASRTGDRSW